MNNPEPLIAAYLDGALSDTERAELNAWLKADAANLRRFTEAVMFEQEIRTATHATAEQHAAADFDSYIVDMKPRSRWLQWRPLAAAAAGIVFGMFCTSMVFGLVSRQQVSVQTLLMEGFEDAEMIPGRGVPTKVDVWSGDLLAPIEAKGEVTPFEGKRMVALPPVGRKAVRFAYRFLDLTSLAPLGAGQSRQIEVTAHFHGEKPGEINRLQMRLAVFAEDVAEARRIWMNDEVNELALLHVAKPVRTDNADWTTVRSAIDVPAEARVLMVVLGAGEPAAYPSRNEHYLDDVQIRLITQDGLLP